jgi:hypothetical protein
MSGLPIRFIMNLRSCFSDIKKPLKSQGVKPKKIEILFGFVMQGLKISSIY